MLTSWAAAARAARRPHSAICGNVATVADRRTLVLRVLDRPKQGNARQVELLFVGTSPLRTPLAQGVWRAEVDQVKRLKELEKENERLRKAVSDLTLEKLILREAASGNF